MLWGHNKGGSPIYLWGLVSTRLLGAGGWGKPGPSMCNGQQLTNHTFICTCCARLCEGSHRPQRQWSEIEGRQSHQGGGVWVWPGETAFELVDRGKLVQIQVSRGRKSNGSERKCVQGVCGGRGDATREGARPDLRGRRLAFSAPRVGDCPTALHAPSHTQICFSISPLE